MTKETRSVKDGEERPFGEALYQSACPSCGDRASWEAAFDADGTCYHAECCGLHLMMSPATVRLAVYVQDEEEEK